MRKEAQRLPVVIAQQVFNEDLFTGETVARLDHPSGMDAQGHDALTVVDQEPTEVCGLRLWQDAWCCHR